MTNVVLTHDHLLIFSEHNCFRIGKNPKGSFGKKFIDIIPSLCWRQFFLADQKHVYLLRDKTGDAKSGLSYFDIERFHDKDRPVGQKYKDLTIELQVAQVGIQSRLDFSKRIQRIGYIKSYKEIVLIPNLHLN